MCPFTPWHLISIHALREESDVPFGANSYLFISFQSTLSVRRATAFTQGLHKRRQRFQSTLSVRRATVMLETQGVEATFQSTLSVRRATSCRGGVRYGGKFQSTLSVRRATRSVSRDSTGICYFNPRSP